MTLDTFIEKYKGKEIDYDGAYRGQCVDLFRQYIKECLTGNQPKGVTGAADFWSNYDSDPNLNQYFDKIPNTLEFIPSEGDVMIWNKRAGGGFGHVAVVKSASQDNFVSFDQNWSKISYCELVNHTYSNVYGVLRPKGIMANELDTCLKDRQKFWDERDSLLRELQADTVEGGVNTVRGLRSRITDLTNQLGTSQAEVKNKEELLSRSNSEVLKLNDDISLLESRLDQSNNTVAQLGRDKGNLAIQVEQLKIQVETLKQANQQGSITQTSTIEQLVSWFKNLWNKN